MSDNFDTRTKVDESYQSKERSSNVDNNSPNYESTNNNNEEKENYSNENNEENEEEGIGKLKDDQEFTTNWDKIVDSFDDMELREELLRGIYGIGFEKPSAIQQRGILPVIQGKDTIAQAQSGTGKTATFSIAALQVLDLKEPSCQVLILAPTRELAQQIWSVIQKLGTYMSITTHACVGGTAVREDINKCQQGCQVVVGTPGRVNDMINRGALRLDKLRIFILDEADEMLSKVLKIRFMIVFNFYQKQYKSHYLVQQCHLKYYN
jgi:translation initiation factor 4A